MTEKDYLKKMFTPIYGEELTDEEVAELIKDDSDESKLFRLFLSTLKEFGKSQAIAFRNWEPPIGNYNSDEDLYEIFEQQKSK